MFGVIRLEITVSYTFMVMWCVVLTAYQLRFMYVVFVWNLGVLEDFGWLEDLATWSDMRMQRGEMGIVANKYSALCSIVTWICVYVYIMLPLMMLVREDSAPIWIMLVVQYVFLFLLNMVIFPRKIYLIRKSLCDQELRTFDRLQ